jgi:hypothetical protein
MLCASMVAAAKTGAEAFTAAHATLMQAVEAGTESPPSQAAWGAAFVTAATHGHLAILDVIVGNGHLSAEASTVATLTKATEAAAKHGQVAVVRRMLGSSLPASDFAFATLWQTALTAAARHDQAAVVRACADHPTAFSTKQTCLQQGLCTAAKFGNTAALGELLDLATAHTREQDLEVLRILVCHGHHTAGALFLAKRPQHVELAKDTYPVFTALAQKTHAAVEAAAFLPPPA